MDKLMQRSKEIYNRLQDDISKDIFQNRLMYSMTGDETFMQKIIDELPEKKTMDEAVGDSQLHAKKLVVYGAGNDFNILMRIYPDFRFKVLCDKSEEKQKKGYRGYSVISPEELLAEKDEDIYVAITTSAYWREIEEFLLKNNFRQKRILNFGKIADALYSKQYFEEKIMIPGEKEVLIDGGCYDCLDIKKFDKWCQGKYDKIYAFEPDNINYSRCMKVIENLNLNRVQLLNKGLWNCKEKLSFSMSGHAGSQIIQDENAEMTIDVVAIDDIVGKDNVTMIKMDIEGAELKALQGAELTIRRCHPRLAISAYHKPEDMIKLASYILSVDSSYKLYFRHYRMLSNETVLYAI